MLELARAHNRRRGPLGVALANASGRACASAWRVAPRRVRVATDAPLGTAARLLSSQVSWAHALAAQDGGQQLPVAAPDTLSAERCIFGEYWRVPYPVTRRNSWRGKRCQSLVAL